MKVVIFGAGRRGLRLARHLIEEKKQVVFLDASSERCAAAVAKLDCLAVCGSATDLDMLKEAGCEDADAVISVTDSDETNLVSCGIVAAEFPKVKQTIAAIRAISYLGRGGLDTAILGISHIVNPEQEAASRITGILETGVFRDFEYFPDAQFVMFTRKVRTNGPFTGKTLADIRKEIPGRYVLPGVRRKGHVFTPSGDTVIREGDEVAIIVDDDESNDTLRSITEIIDDKLFRIAIVGGTRIANYMFTQMDEHELKRITLIDKSAEVCEKFVSDFPGLLVLNGSITDEAFWDEERIGSYDLIVAITENDELNIIVASYAKRIGVRRSIALIKTNNNYLQLAEAMDIDAAISITDATVDTITKYLRGAGIQSLHSIFDGDLEVYEYAVSPDFRYIGRKLSDVSLKGKAIIAGVKSAGGNNFIPDGSYAFSEGDTLLVASTHQNFDFVQDLFSSHGAEKQ